MNNPTRNKKDLEWAKKCVFKLEAIQAKRPLTQKEIQEKYYWESKIEDEYNKPLL